MKSFEKLFESAFPFWNDASLADKNSLIKNSTIVKYSKGDIVHGINGGCTGVILVVKGELRTYMLSEDGKEVTLYKLKAGDVCMLSASCVLDSIVFNVVVDATKDSECCKINSTIYGNLCDKNIYAKNYALSVAVQRFSEVMFNLQNILFLSIDKRLAKYLIDNCNENNEILSSQENIAKEIGSVREVVSRMLKNFKEDKVIDYTRNCITILDKEKLFKI